MTTIEISEATAEIALGAVNDQLESVSRAILRSKGNERTAPRQRQLGRDHRLLDLARREIIAQLAQAGPSAERAEIPRRPSVADDDPLKRRP
jgi:hypothetical protein